MFDFISVGFEAIRDFMEMGGWVLYVIAAVLIFMWFLIIERILYIFGGHRAELKEAFAVWNARSEKSSWDAHQIRLKLISSVSMKLHGSIPVIKACVTLCPLLGLLGTVTGMIDVFQVMAISGSGNVQGMAGGVSKATIPTMAGMVATLSGIFLSIWLQRVYERERELLAERLTLD